MIGFKEIIALLCAIAGFLLGFSWGGQYGDWAGKLLGGVGGFILGFGVGWLYAVFTFYIPLAISNRIGYRNRWITALISTLWMLLMSGWIAAIILATQYASRLRE